MRPKSQHGGRRPGAGRKPVPPELHRNRRVMVNLTESEHESLERALSKTEARSVSDYIRDLVLRHLRRAR